MTDDIVARLRDQEEFGLLGVPGDHRCVSYGDAADEIERLKAELANARATAIEEAAKASEANFFELTESNDEAVANYARGRIEAGNAIRAATNITFGRK